MDINFPLMQKNHLFLNFVWVIIKNNNDIESGTKTKKLLISSDSINDGHMDTNWHANSDTTWFVYLEIATLASSISTPNCQLTHTSSQDFHQIVFLIDTRALLSTSALNEIHLPDNWPGREHVGCNYVNRNHVQIFRRTRHSTENLSASPSRTRRRLYFGEGAVLYCR